MKKQGESHKFLVDSIENMNDSFVVTDSQWKVKYVNRNAEKLLGHKKEYLLGKNMFRLLPEGKKSLLWTYAKKSIKTNKHSKFDIYSSRLSKWLEVRLYPLSDAISFYFTDISMRKKAEFRQEFISRINSTIALSLDYN